MLAHAVSMAVAAGLFCGTMVAGTAAYAAESGQGNAQEMVESGQPVVDDADDMDDTPAGETDGTGTETGEQTGSTDSTESGDPSDSEGQTEPENPSSNETAEPDDSSDSTDTKQTVDFDKHTIKDAVSPSGTTINLFDYWMEERDSVDTGKDGTNGQPNWVTGTNFGINENHDFKFAYGGGNGNGINNWTGVGGGPRRGIVNNTLTDGMPTLTSGKKESLSYLFNLSDNSASDYRKAFSNVSGLLQVNDDGYYYYNSHENFASFNESAKAFTLYDEPGVKTGGSSPNGQFFPFNKVSDVFESENTDGSLVAKNIRSTNNAIRHWHGLTLTSRFKQPAGGQVQSGPDESQDMTFDFSGDDDVWIFIDGVLVGDLGGIHDENRISINFATGKVQTYKKLNPETGWDGDPDKDSETTIKDMFEKAGKGNAARWNGNTFADGSYHTLKFFYLERGNYDSNMHLEFNLVPIPESSIVKIDQAGNPVSGAEFALYATDGDYAIQENDVPLFKGTTDSDGNLLLTDSDGQPMPISDLKLKSGKTHFVLRETNVPKGYRSPGDIKLQFHESGDDHSEFSPYLTVEQENIWQTGAYAAAGVQVTAPWRLYTANADGSQGAEIQDVFEGQKLKGTLFAVIMMYTGEQTGADADLSNGENWTGISGNPDKGWDKNGKTGWNAVLNATKYTFALSKNATGTSAQYQVHIPELPGDPTEYYNLLSGDQRKNTKYTVAYYYTTADDANSATQENSKRLWLNGTAGETFDRMFSVNLHVPNISNALIVQKLDQNGRPLSSGSATFSLYKENDVTVVDGAPTVNENAQPYDTAHTRDLDGTSRLKIPAAAYFPSGESNTILEKGTYWLIETEAPEHYVKNTKATKVVVDNTGVYADAGSAGDGITVRRGVGSLVKTLSQFGDKGNIDSTLHDVTASLKTTTNYQGDQTAWDENATDIGGSPVEGMDVRGRQSLKLTFGGVGSNAHNVMLEYGPTDALMEANLMNTSLGVDVGWPALNITQNKKPYNDSANSHTDAPKQDLTDKSLNNLFSNTAIVRVQDQLSTKLTIKKVVEGASVPADMKFNFTVTLRDRYGNVLDDTKRIEFDRLLKLTYYTVNESGMATHIKDLDLDGSGAVEFSIADGESVVIEGLPDQAKYEVAETGVSGTDSADGMTLDSFQTSYEVVANNLLTKDSRKWVPGTGDGTEMKMCPSENKTNGPRDVASTGCQLATRTEASVTFTNTLMGPELPSTGGAGVKSMLWGGLLLVGCSLAGLRYVRRRW